MPDLQGTLCGEEIRRVMEKSLREELRARPQIAY